MGTQELSTVNPPVSCSETLHRIQGPGNTFLKINISPMRTSLVAQMVKRLPTMRETQVQSLGWEDPLEKEMATHSSILVRKIPWAEEPGRLPSIGLHRVGHD